MGYIEDIQKINKLARELMNHGIAKSLDDAVKQAREMLKDGHNTSILHKSVDVDTGAIQEEIKLPDQVKEESEMTWQEAMKKNNEYVVKELKDAENGLRMFSQQIVDLQNEFTAYKKEMNRKISQLENRPAASAPLQQGPAPQSQSAGHAKTGNSKPEEVSIEKMFYFGNKKQ